MAKSDIKIKEFVSKMRDEVERKDFNIYKLIKCGKEKA